MYLHVVPLSSTLSWFLVCLPLDEGTDLAQSSMWSVDLSWSEQAEALRMVAVQSPQTFTVDYARKSISQLRVVGREVCTVDLL